MLLQNVIEVATRIVEEMQDKTFSDPPRRSSSTVTNFQDILLFCNGNYIHNHYKILNWQAHRYNILFAASNCVSVIHHCLQGDVEVKKDSDCLGFYLAFASAH